MEISCGENRFLMLMNGLLLLGMGLGILGEAFIAASEISLVVSDKLSFLDRKEEEAEAMPLLRILTDPQRISHTLLIGTLLSTGVSTLFFVLLILRLVQDVSLGATVFLLLAIHLPLMMIFGEIIPRVYYFNRAEEGAIKIAKPLHSFMSLLKPLIDLSVRFHNGVQNLAGRSKTESNPFVGNEDLELIRRFAEGSETLLKEEIKIVTKILDFSDIRVQEILVPIDHVISVSEEATISEAMEQVFKSGFTRLPVYRVETRRIVGLLHALDLLRIQSLGRKIVDCYRKPFFVRKDTLIRDLFRSMQKRGVMIAVVQDREGHAQGIVTMEDILEEIFGEIEDEFDLKDQLFREIGEKEYLVNARIDVKELNDQLHLNIPRDGYKTLSGYILHHLNRIPQEGERFTIGSLMFKIELADERQIYKLFLKRL
jgi:CBS domain containing-hemolysin-like protein